MKAAPRHWSSLVSAVTAVFLVLALPGCGLTRRSGLAGKPNFTIQFNVSEAANQNNPVAVDLVLVMDKKLPKEIGKLSAKDWFERRIQLQRDFPEQIQVVSWEWVPRQKTGPLTIDVQAKTRVGFVFANYQTPGDHRAQIEITKPVVVSLAEQSFLVQALQ